MKKTLSIVLLIFVSCFLISFISNKKQENILSCNKSGVNQVFNSSNPPVFTTGAPGENNCTACHSGSPLNPSGVVNFSFSGINNSYELNQDYTIELSINNTLRNGFELTILDAYNQFAGHFTSGSNTSVTLANNKEYISHNASLGQNSFQFVWHSPSVDMNNLFVYYCFNESNNSGNTSGDKIYVGQELLTHSNVNLKEELSNQKIDINYVPNNHSIFIQTKEKSIDLNIIIYNLNGQLLSKKVIENHDFFYSYKLPNEINNQIIIIQIQYGTEYYSKKILIN